MAPVVLSDRPNIAAPPDRVRALLRDVAGVIGCIPGATLTRDNGDGTYAAAIGVQYGETGVRFNGTIRVDRPSDDAVAVTAEGRDAAGAVRAEGRIDLAIGEWDGATTGVRVDAQFTFSGVLAPLARSATKIVGPQLISTFARCLASKAASAGGGQGLK